MKNTVSITPSKHRDYTHRVRFLGPNRKRVYRYFYNETDALTFAKDQTKEIGESGTDFGSMSEDERAALAFWRVFTKTSTPTPPDLLSVMSDFKAQWLASKASVTVTHGIERFLEHQEADGASKRHLASLRSRLGRFAAEIGDKHVSAVTVGSFTDWLNGLRAKRADKAGEKLTAVTRHNLSRSLRSFFVFAMDRGWTLANPIPAEKRTKNKSSKLANQKAPAVLLPADVARFMGAVEAKSPSLVSFWAVKFFAGIRDAEASRMTWDMIDLAAGRIHLPASDSKTGEARTMKIEPSLAAWLKPYANESGAICPGGTTRKRGFKRAVDSLATVDAMGRVTKEFVFPSNAARHSFGTYHLFHFRNAGETALQLGHKSNPAMLHEHYKNPSAEKHAAAFWKIRPGTGPSNVIPMGQPADETLPANTKRRKTAQ